MPLYTYKCSKCGLEKTELQPLGSQKVPECHVCVIKMIRNVKGTSFSISGPGVYKQGFSSPKKPGGMNGNIFRPTGGKKK